MTLERAHKTVFCFPYKGTGGVSLLFLNIAEVFAIRGIDVAIVDYIDGFMAAHRTEPRLQLITYDDNSEVPIPENATVVFQSMTPWSIYPSLRIPQSARVLFWNLHPFNLVPTLPGSRRLMQSSQTVGRVILSTLLRGYRDRMRRLIRVLECRNSLVFMDRSNLETTESYLQITIPKPQMLAIGIPAASASIASDQHADFGRSGLRLAWIGRIVDFKYFILVHALEELNRIQPELAIPLEMTVVGTGEYVLKLRALAPRLTRLSVRFVEHLPPASLGTFLCGNVDVLFAMGTSALEGARAGIPTCLLDVSYKKVTPAYEFRWLHEADGFTLGDMAAERAAGSSHDSLKKRMRDVVLDYPALSAAALKYFETHHSMAQVASRLLQVLAGAQCTYGELAQRGLVRRGMVYSSFAATRRLILGGS